MLIALSALAATTLEPMLDGRCDEYAGAETHALGGSVRMFLTQTRDHVWLCFAVPEGSYGTLDLRIEAPRLPKALNLHASAQLGEWVADDPAAAPKNGRDPLWWRLGGWWANVVRAGGVIGGQIDYRTLTGREIQLSKARFGRGDWRVSANLSDVAAPAGQMSAVKWPANGTHHIKAE